VSADTIVPLIQNAALLVAIAVLADSTGNRWAPGQMARGQVLIGLLVGLAAVAVMATPLRLEPGIIFDVRSVLLSLSGLFFGSVATDLAAVTVDSKRASALGLILNELLTNSLKHAFPAGRAGSVRVSTRTQEGHLSIEVGDDGVGFSRRAPGSSRAGVGLQLVDGLVQQLNGELSRSDQDGTRIEISLPLN
jgi:signal transduction histidine kinase